MTYWFSFLSSKKFSIKLAWLWCKYCYISLHFPLKKIRQFLYFCPRGYTRPQHQHSCGIVTHPLQKYITHPPPNCLGSVGQLLHSSPIAQKPVSMPLLLFPLPSSNTALFSESPLSSKAPSDYLIIFDHPLCSLCTSISPVSHPHCLARPSPKHF